MSAVRLTAAQERELRWVAAHSPGTTDPPYKLDAVYNRLADYGLLEWIGYVEASGGWAVAPAGRAWLEANP